MAPESFEKQDKAFMEALKGTREKKVPPMMLKGFSASVEKKIREKQPSLEIQLKPKRVWIPVWVPVLTVLVIGSLLVLRMPYEMKGPDIVHHYKVVELADASELSDEIAALRELGAWTDEDEKATGIATETDAEDLELSNANSVPDSQQA